MARLASEIRPSLPQSYLHDVCTQAGALELESAELRFETSADGRDAEVAKKKELPMMRMVAEAMIGANSAVAKRISDAFPAAALLRRHPPPPAEAFAEVLFSVPERTEVCAPKAHQRRLSAAAAQVEAFAEVLLRIPECPGASASKAHQRRLSGGDTRCRVSRPLLRCALCFTNVLVALIA